MRPFLLYMFLSVNNFPALSAQRLTPPRRYNHYDDDNDILVTDENEDELDNNGTDMGMYVGAPCEATCSSKLSHVLCDPVSKACRCEKRYPVLLNPTRGCGKPKRLGEQCYYRESCTYSDLHSSCVQVHHNAICQCDSGYHQVSIQKPSNRTFCAEDVKIMTTDYSTLAGVLSGIALLSGLICYVLHLFNQNRYTGPHRFGNANIAPPIFFSNDAGFPLTVPIVSRGSSGSRASSQRTLASVSSRRGSSYYQSYQSYRGTQTSASRAGSRRPSLSSIQSCSSIRSYSARRFEREREQKEEREMQKRLAKMTSAMQANGRIQPTPSPRSTDELLPTLTEDKPVPLALQEEETSPNNGLNEDVPSTSKQFVQ